MVHPTGDVRLALEGGRGPADLVLGAADLVRDEGLGTAVLVSLFTDRRLEDAAAERFGDEERRGYWADTAGDRWGSLLWVLERQALTPEVVSLAQQTVRDSLQWMVAEGIATRVDVVATRTGDCLGLTVRATRSRDARWAHLWEGTARSRYDLGQVQLSLEAA